MPQPNLNENFDKKLIQKKLGIQFSFKFLFHKQECTMLNKAEHEVMDFVAVHLFHFSYLIVILTFDFIFEFQF